MNVLVDAKEKDRVPLAIKTFDAQVVDLPVGDYLFNEEVVFEYKTLDDFCKSVMDNRVFNQGLNQRLDYKYHFIIVELGDFQCTKSGWDKLYYRTNVSCTMFRSAVASLNTYTTVLLVPGDVEECFLWMSTQARKCLEEKTLCKYPEIKTANSAMNFLCNDVRGIGPAKAEAITDCLGLETLTDLLNLTHEDLVMVDGVGDKTADNILEKIKKES